VNILSNHMKIFNFIESDRNKRYRFEQNIILNVPIATISAGVKAIKHRAETLLQRSVIET